MTQVEYARCVLMIVKNEETQSNIDEAARILQDVQVETYGSMDHREKIEFILYQMKVMVKKSDMIRLLIVSRKVTDKTFKGQGIEDLRTQYHAYFSIYHGSEQNLFESAKSMKAIVDSMLTNAPELSKLPAVNEFGFKFDLDTVFQNLIFFTIISDYSEEKTKMLKDIQTSYLSLLEKKPLLEKLVVGILSKELIATNIESWGIDKVEIFQDGYPHAAEHKVNFKKQLIQHNVIICSSYYERVRLHRLAELSHVAPAELEEEASYLINSDIVKGKMDRVEGVIVFRRQRVDDEILDDWVTDVNNLLDLVNHTCNLIDREEDVMAN
jgi:26S proteasome regulatory subunit N5